MNKYMKCSSCNVTIPNLRNIGDSSEEYTVCYGPHCFIDQHTDKPINKPINKLTNKGNKHEH